MAYEKIAAVLDKRPSDVRITSLSFTPSIGSKSTMAVKGVADTRSGLVLFTELLEDDELFETVELPVRDLAKSTDISFTISFDVN